MERAEEARWKQVFPVIHEEEKWGSEENLIGKFTVRPAEEEDRKAGKGYAQAIWCGKKLFLAGVWKGVEKCVHHGVAVLLLYDHNISPLILFVSSESNQSLPRSGKASSCHLCFIMLLLLPNNWRQTSSSHMPPWQFWFP